MHSRCSISNCWIIEWVSRVSLGEHQVGKAGSCKRVKRRLGGGCPEHQCCGASYLPVFKNLKCPTGDDRTSTTGTYTRWVLKISILTSHKFKGHHPLIIYGNSAPPTRIGHMEVGTYCRPVTESGEGPHREEPKNQPESKLPTTWHQRGSSKDLPCQSHVCA